MATTCLPNPHGRRTMRVWAEVSPMPSSQAMGPQRTSGAKRVAPGAVAIAMFLLMFKAKYFFPDYLSGIGDHWVVLMSGLVSVLLTIWERHIKIPHMVFYAIAAMCVFIAGFLAWRDEYSKTHPGVVLTIDELGVGSDVTNSYARIFITADVANRSSPTALDGWQLEMTLPDSKDKIKALPTYIDPDRPLEFTGTHAPNADFKMDSADTLYNKTKPNPLPNGAKVPGVLAFDIHGKTADQIRVKGAVFTLTCKTVFGDTVKGVAIWTGVDTPHHYIPGLKPPPK